MDESKAPSYITLQPLPHLLLGHPLWKCSPCHPKYNALCWRHPKSCLPRPKGCDFHVLCECYLNLSNIPTSSQQCQKCTKANNISDALPYVSWIINTPYIGFLVGPKHRLANSRWRFFFPLSCALWTTLFASWKKSTSVRTSNPIIHQLHKGVKGISEFSIETSRSLESSLMRSESI